MTKKDIKIGDVIICKNGYKYICINDTTFVNNDGYLHMREFDDELNNTSIDSFSIQKIYRPATEAPGCFGLGFNAVLTMQHYKYNVVYDRNTITISLAYLKQLLIDKFDKNVNVFDDETGETLFTATAEICSDK